jgi:hypothetical protein
MTRLVIAIALIASCSGKGKQGPTTTEPPPAAKRVSLTWGFEKQGEMADVFLAATDETGKQVSTPIGRYKGECAAITPAKEMNAITGAACKTGGTGTELHAVVQGSEVIILQLGINEGVTPDPTAREEVTRVKVPLGAKIELGT